MLADELQERVQARRPGDRDGSRPLLHALARRQGRRLDDDQQRDARRVPEGRQPAPRIPLAAVQEERLTEDSTMLVRLMYASRAVDAGRRRRAARRSCAVAAPTTPRTASPACCASPSASSCRCSKAAAAAVNQLYNRIAADARHRDVVLLQLPGNRRAPLRRLVDGPGEHRPQPGAAAEVLGPAGSIPLPCRAGCRWPCSRTWSRPRRSLAAPAASAQRVPACAALSRR